MSTSNSYHVSKAKNLFETADEANRKSIDITLDFVKHQITLSALLISLSIAFTNGAQNSFELLLKVAVGLLIFSFICGFFLMSLVSRGVSQNWTYVMEQAKVRILGTLQGFLFVSGVVCMAFSILFD